MKDKDVVGTFGMMVLGIIESYVEEFATVELALVVALIDNVDVKIGKLAFGLEFGQKGYHVGNESSKVFRSLLFGVQISKGNDDCHVDRIYQS